MNKNIYSYEFDADAELAEEIDKEVYSLEEYPGEDDDEAKSTQKYLKNTSNDFCVFQT